MKIFYIADKIYDIIWRKYVYNKHYKNNRRFSSLIVRRSRTQEAKIRINGIIFQVSDCSANNVNEFRVVVCVPQQLCGGKRAI